MTCECPREQDVLDALAAQRWPRRAEPELQAHVAACAICTDLIAVVRPLLEEQDAALQDVRVPPASVVWWQAQIRARNEAAQTASRMVTLGQAVAAVAVLALAVGLVAGGWARVDGWSTALQAIVTNVREIYIPLPTLPTLSAESRIALYVAIAASIFLAPIAIYFAVGDE